MQLVLFHVHCNYPMHGHGTDRKRHRYRCSKCGDVIVDGQLKFKRHVGDTFIVNLRLAVYLGHTHPMANTDGWQYVHRVIVSTLLGRVLHPDEHVDHIDGDKNNNSMNNFRLLLNVEHGKHHVYGPRRYKVLAEWVGGSFVEYEEPRDMADF